MARIGRDWTIREAHEYDDAFTKDADKIDRLVRWLEDRDPDEAPVWMCKAFAMALDVQEDYRRVERGLREIEDAEWDRELRSLHREAARLTGGSSF